MKTPQTLLRIFRPFFSLQTRFPFDSNNLVGYSIEAIFEYIMFGYSYFVSASTLGLAFGLLWIAISATKEIERIFHLINDEAQTNDGQSTELNTNELNEFSELIYTHSNLKQFRINPFNY